MDSLRPAKLVHFALLDTAQIPNDNAKLRKLVGLIIFDN